jgi:Leucine-rich repeat (LRR) protein
MYRTTISIQKKTRRLQLLTMAIALIGFVGCKKNDDGPAPIKEIAKSSAKEISGFEFSVPNDLGTLVTITGTIDATAKAITAAVPPNTDVTGLLPNIVISEMAEVKPTTAQNFTNPIEYTVTAEDGSKVVYTVNVTVALNQRQILQTFLDANPGNTLGWDLANTIDLGTLDGVTTNVEGNIIELDLVNKTLTQFSPEIGQLTSLTFLRLFFNQLTSIPQEIGQLINLTSLDLGSNQLTSIPLEIWHLTSLTKLYLHNNQLVSIPPEIGQLTSLTDLLLANNQLISIPSEIGQLTSLKVLSLGRNQLTSIPSEIGQLTSLTSLDLQSNQLTSLLPEIGQLTSLTNLFLSDNQLTSIPSEIEQLTSLIVLGLASNKLTTILQEIGQLTSLTKLYLHNNQLISIPPEIGFMTNLSILNVSRNNLTTIPRAICNLKEFNNPSMAFPRDVGVTCETTSARDALISIYSANPGNTLEWGVNNYPGVSFDGNQSVTTIDIKNKGISRITSAVGTLEDLELLDLRNNPLNSIANEVCALTFTSDFTILTDPGEGCQ